PGDFRGPGRVRSGSLRISTGAGGLLSEGMRSVIVRTPGVLATASTTDAERRVFAKIGWRLMPILILAYVFNYLDRNNVGFPRLTMNQAIGPPANAVGFCARGVLC